MSVQNGERLATKQDLADMYSGLLPYLGGMPEVLANKFSKGDLYDTSEKMIGKWIDGKPVFQRTIQDTIPQASSSIVDKYISIGASIDKCISMTGFFIYNNSSMVPIPCDLGVNNTSLVRMYVTNNDYSAHPNCINLRNGYGSFNDSPVYMTIQYTKTTDSANSFNIGEVTDYSTTEKIIGTWLNGELLYQRTIQTTTPNRTSSDTLIYVFDDADIITNILGYVVDTSISSQKGSIPINIYYSNSAYVAVFAGDGTDTSKRALYCRCSGWINSPMTITAQYTKSTT